MEQLSISSFICHGHSYHLYAYNDLKGLPEGADLMDANDILPADKIFQYKHHRSYAGFANLFRYKLLFEKGGYWVDCDLVCLRPFDSDPEFAFVKVPDRRGLLHWKKTFHVSNWFIKATPGSDIMHYCYQEALKRNPEELQWGETGARLISHAVEEHGMQKYIVKEGTFCPLYFWQWKRLVSGSRTTQKKLKQSMAGTYGIHMYNEMWRRNNMGKSKNFHPASIYEELKRHYLTGIEQNG